MHESPDLPNKLLSLFPGAPLGKLGLEASERPRSSNNYLVCITPRSGSTLLTHCLADTGILGKPHEWFNYDSILPLRDEFGSKTILEYIDCLRRYHQSNNGVFGVEVAYPHLETLLELVTFDQVFDGLCRWFYLRRKNIILQGISLYLADHSGYFHSVQQDHRAKEIYDSLPYDAPEIKRSIRTILHQELEFERMFRNLRVQPVRLSYEEFVADKAATVALFRNVLGIGEDCVDPTEDKVKKISSSRSSEWEEKFRREQDAFIVSVESKRQAFRIEFIAP